MTPVFVVRLSQHLINVRVRATCVSFACARHFGLDKCCSWRESTAS